MSDYSMKAVVTLDEKSVCIEINGEKYVKENHRWKNSKGESAANLNGILETLRVTALDFKRVTEYEAARKTTATATPELEAGEPTVSGGGLSTESSEGDDQ